MLAEPRYHRRPVSRTFHGRDVFAPVAAHCSRGVRLAALGPALRARCVSPAPPAHAGPRGRVEGEVLLADRFGNLLTNLTAAAAAGSPARGVLPDRRRPRARAGRHLRRPPASGRWGP